MGNKSEINFYEKWEGVISASMKSGNSEYIKWIVGIHRIANRVVLKTVKLVGD